MFDLACVINGRNLGDAVIQSRSVRKLLDGGFTRALIVWTRPQSVPAYQDLPNVEIVTSPFPVGTNRTFGFAGLLEFLGAARRIRRRKVQVSVDFFGDVRERLFARAISSPSHIGINWADHHPFRRSIRLPQRSGAKPNGLVVPPEMVNVYDAQALFVDSLLGSRRRSDGNEPVPRKVKQLRVVGFHPCASQDSKLWPDRNWVELSARLLQDDLELRVFGSPAERAQIERTFQPVRQQVTVLTSKFGLFLQEASEVDLMIGLDSLGVHAADRAGVPSIMLAGANLPEMWAPPLSISIGQSGGCPCYPCYNRPVCRGKAGEYACIRSVSVNQVLAAVNRVRAAYFAG